MKQLLRYALILVVLLPAPLLAAAGEQAASPRFVATYFYTNVRCPSCRTIERWTEETIQDRFSREIDSGVLQWRTVNLDAEGNFHYVKDYQLYTKSVILSEMSGDREVRWKNLARVWELLRNEARFRKYVASEVQEFMGQP